MQKTVVLAAVVLAGAIWLPEQSLAAPGGRGMMPAFRAPMMMRHAPRPFVGHRPVARPHGFGHRPPTTRPYGTINPSTPYGTIKPNTPFGSVAHTPVVGAVGLRQHSPLVRRHHRLHHKGWHFPATFEGAVGYIGVPYDPAEVIPVYGPPPLVGEMPPADAPAAAPMTAPRFTGTRDENADACRSERVTVPAAEGERTITVVRC
jgi:hypothetical protein